MARPRFMALSLGVLVATSLPVAAWAAAPTPTSPFLPPQGVLFKLENCDSKLWIYANEDGRFGAYRGGTYADQYWRIVEGHGDYDGYFKLENSASGRWIYSNPDGRFNAYRGGTYADQYWRTVPGDAGPEGCFKLENLASRKWIYANQDGRFNAYRGGDYSDQYWRFVFEETEVLSVEFDADRGVIKNIRPEVLAFETLDNDSSVQQTMEFVVAATEEHSSHFEHEHGFSIGVGASFKAGIPFVGEGEVQVSATTEHTWTFGTTETIGKTYEARFPVNAPPYSRVVAKGIVQRGELEVPYRVVSRGKKSGVEVHSGGTWSGVTTWDLQFEVSELPDDGE